MVSELGLNAEKWLACAQVCRRSRANSGAKHLETMRACSGGAMRSCSGEVMRCEHEYEAVIDSIGRYLLEGEENQRQGGQEKAAEEEEACNSLGGGVSFGGDCHSGA